MAICSFLYAMHGGRAFGPGFRDQPEIHFARHEGSTIGESIGGLPCLERRKRKYERNPKATDFSFEPRTAILRVGIGKFVTNCRAEKNYDAGNLSKLFVLNRPLIAVPPRENFSGPFFGGWEGVPQDNQEMNMMWPLSLEKDGNLRLTGVFSGYSGRPYFAVQEFDHFLAEYGRRQMGATKAPKLE
jgi:hypothetical protein